MGDEGIITDKTPKPEAFKFTEILHDTLPYQIVGYTEGRCPDATNPYGYLPPAGWKITSCNWMPPGTHGVAAGKPVILVYCEPIRNDIPPIGIGEITSALYPKPSETVEISGRAYTIPGTKGFYVEQKDSIRYSTYGIPLSQLGYVEGEQVVAKIKLSPVYEDIIDVDQWGYVADLIDIRKASDTNYSQTPQFLNVDSTPNLMFIGAAALAGVALLGGYIWYNSHRK